MNSPIRGIAFDLDDTLFSRQKAVEFLLRSWNKGPLSPAQLKMISEKDEQGYSERSEFFSWLGCFLNLDRSGSELQLRFIQELPRHIPRQTSSIDILGKLQNAGYSTAILTNGGSALQRAKLQASGIIEHVEHSKVIVAGETPYDKPEPEIFHHLADKMNLPADNILYVGDHLINDIVGAGSAGFHCAWMRMGRCIPRELSQNVFVIDHLEELLTQLLGNEYP